MCYDSCLTSTSIITKEKHDLQPASGLGRILKAPEYAYFYQAIYKDFLNAISNLKTLILKKRGQALSIEKTISRVRKYLLTAIWLNAMKAKKLGDEGIFKGFHMHMISWKHVQQYLKPKAQTTELDSNHQFFLNSCYSLPVSCTNNSPITTTTFCTYIQ